MEKLRIQVCGTDVHVTELGKLTTGMVGATASFSFSPEWNGLLKTAVFCSGIKKDVILTGDTVKIPPECIRTPALTVGVYGHLADGTVVIPTVMSKRIEVATGTKPSGDTQSGFTPDKWMQLLGMIGDLSMLTTDDKANLVAAINEAARKGGGAVDPAEIQRIVQEYLAANPPTVKETDPTVSAWAKQPQKPSYTAEEVGAQPKGRYIKTVNGAAPDESGNVKVYIPEGGGSATVYCVTDYGISTEAEDNTPALQALVDLVSTNGGGTIFFPVGVYKFKPGNLTDKYPHQKTAIMMPSNVSVVGENIEKTVLKQTADIPYSMFRKMGEPDTPITGCTFSNFTVDAYDTGDVNAVHGKAFFFQYVRDCVFRDLILRGTVATAMGIDFLDRVLIDNVSCIDCGRTFTGNEAGTSGIGIGTAGWENENFIVTNCICDGCGQYGIFIENQGLFGDGNVDYAKGCIISNCIVRNGLNKGIGVRGGQNVTVIGCETYENTSHGIYVDNNCKDVKVISCSSIANGGCGINIEPNSQSKRIVVRDCHFTDNEMQGISVITPSTSLCLSNNYTAGNSVGFKISPIVLVDCAIKGNIIFDGDDVKAVFAGDNKYNDFAIEIPDIKSTVITADMYTGGYKLSPDGTLESAEQNAFTTISYIDVSELPNTFDFTFGDTKGSGIRVAQYGENKVSLSDNFEQPWIGGATTTSITITKLAGCRYIRIFSSGNPTVGELESISAPDAPSGTTITADMYTAGKKLMPNGSLADESSAYTTIGFIDVSELPNTFYFIFGDTKGTGLRIAQYDTDKNSLGDSFSMINISETRTSISVEKLEGCKYIRIMSSALPTVGELENTLSE